MQKVLQYLQKNTIDYIIHNHKPVFTCEEAERECGAIPGIASKNIFLRNKKKTHFFLLTLPGDKRLNIKDFEKQVDQKNLSFASAELLMDKLGLIPGSVSPFGLINDNEDSVEFFLHQDVYESPIVSFHPNNNSATLELSQEMFQKFLQTLPKYTIFS